MRVLVIVMMLLVPAVALAQPAAPAGPVDPTVPGAYNSPMRGVCEEELAKDKAWLADLEARLRAKIHRQASTEITTNNRHVAIAYGAMWVLAVGFVVFLWRRQQALKAEIERLAAELKKAEGT